VKKGAVVEGPRRCRRGRSRGAKKVYKGLQKRGQGVEGGVVEGAKV
jgi:hypothetical protein